MCFCSTVDLASSYLPVDSLFPSGMWVVVGDMPTLPSMATAAFHVHLNWNACRNAVVMMLTKSLTYNLL
jgi:hypothetical protein